MSERLNAEQRQRLEELFDRAAELEVPERDVFVNRECDQDPVLRNELVSLLDSLSGDDGSLERLLEVPGGGGPEEQETEDVPERVVVLDPADGRIIDIP